MFDSLFRDKFWKRLWNQGVHRRELSSFTIKWKRYLVRASQIQDMKIMTQPHPPRELDNNNKLHHSTHPKLAAYNANHNKNTISKNYSHHEPKGKIPNVASTYDSLMSSTSHYSIHPSKINASVNQNHPTPSTSS